jgi:hypothetical protein
LTLLTFTGSFNPSDPCATAALPLLVIAAVITGIAILVLTWAVARFRVSDAVERGS